MGLRERFPEWMFRRPRRTFGESEFRPLSLQEQGDRRACQGADPLEAADNWMRHVLDRDFEYPEITRAIVVVEVGRGPRAQTLYTTHRVDATPVEVRGLLSEALRGQSEIIARANRHRDIDNYAKATVPQLLDALEGPASEAVRLKLADALVKMQADCLNAAAISTHENVRKAYLEASEWAEQRFKEIASKRWSEELAEWERKQAAEERVA